VAAGSPPTVRRRQLGRELRRLREQNGMLAEQLAEHMHCSPSRISRIETARIRISPGTVHEILDALEVGGAERSRLVALARDAEEPGWWQAYTDALPYEYSTLIALESEAVSLQAFEPIVVHGLLQTEAYAHAVAERSTLEEIRARVEARLNRQAILTKDDAPTLHVVLDESVLHHVFGSREILRDQLVRLIEWAELPNVTIQVLPFESAEALKVLTGPFIILRFRDVDDGPVIYVENLAGDLYLEKADAIALYTSAYKRLCETALDPPSSIKKIASLARGETARLRTRPQRS
jgi:transcriptional regulator with XRE-family HTH domain